MALEDYRRKRDFSTTPEPAGEAGSESGRLYVIQKHAASRLHYDFRLELDGVLLSWAVPKGPSLDPRDRHLAVRVEDHPVEYGSFDGTIPKGEYGGGTVALWDRGTWEPEGDPHAGLAKGDLKFTLHGEKLQGSWVLVRMRGRSEAEGKENWLLIKHRDAHAVDGDGAAILAGRPESVASGRTIDEIAAEAVAAPVTAPPDAPAPARPEGSGRTAPDPSALPGATAETRLPRFVRPELAKLVAGAPGGDGWLHEIKYDGYRALSRIEDGRATMYSRNEHDWTERWRPVADALAALPVSSAILDGEVVVEVEGGRTSFGALQTDLSEGRTDRLRYFLFDLLYLDGYDLTGVPLARRKQMLRELLEAAGPQERLRYADDVRGQGAAVLASACTLALEGVVSKKADAPYRSGQRGPGWLKSKCLQRQEFVIVGWTPPSGSRVGFGALLLAVNDPDGTLRYIGKVGTGFSDRFLTEFGERMRAITVPGPSVGRGAERAPKDARWVEPRFVGEVAFAEWTSDGTIRHQTFQGLREDKSPADVALEDPGAGADAARAEVTLTHPERVFWPETGTTKQDLADYFAWVAPFMLPYVLGRPISMVRCPSGVGPVSSGRRLSGGPGQCFFHKHPGADFPGPFERVEIVESQGPGLYLTITGPESLTALAQMGVLEVHTWGATWPGIERPDLVVLDLDPSDEVGWRELAVGARLVRDVLDGLGLESFVKTTGGKGLHVCVPIEPAEDWEVVKGFAKAVADAIAAYEPDRYVSTMSKAKRVGRVYIDYLRNARAATFIAPYSTRARTRPTVSVPLRWDELGGRIRPDTYDIGNLRRRLAHLPGDPWEGFFDLRQAITPKMRAEIGAP